MRVSFAVGTIWGYKFDAEGHPTERKSYTFSKSSGADSTGPVPRTGQPGQWLPISNGIFAGFDVEMTGIATALTEPRPAKPVYVPPPTGDTTGPVITGPTADSITETSARITWSLSEPGTGQVEYGATTSYGSLSTAETSFNYTTHVQIIGGLTAGTDYHFRVKSKDAAGNETISPDKTFTTTAVVVVPPPVTPPPSGDVQPPLITFGNVNPSASPMPPKLVPITDPVFGTRITRISDNLQRHAYARQQPWSPGEKYLYLYYPDDGNGHVILDGKTFAFIKKLSPGGSGATWINDAEMVSAGGGGLLKKNMETGASSTLPNSPSGSIGAGEGAPSDDFRYWAVLNGATVMVYDMTAQATISQFNLGATPNNCTMSRKGNYVIVQYSPRGTGTTQGTWLFTRSGTRVRQMWTMPAHMDPGLDASGKEVAVGIIDGALDCQFLDSGQHYNLAKLPNVWAWVGHVSSRFPGWADASPSSWHTNGTPGNDQLASFDMSKPDSPQARVWGHGHCWSGASYLQAPMAVRSPSGRFLLFSSMWTSGSSGYASYIAQKGT